MKQSVGFLIVTFAVALGGTACKAAASLGSSSTSKPTKPSKEDCKQELKASEAANMACIVEGDGTSKRVGDVISFTCPSFEPSRFTFVNGSGPFPLASSICYAATFAGKLDPAVGGAVKIEILAAQTKYPGDGVKNGIKSQTWEGSYGTPGYQFVE